MKSNPNKIASVTVLLLVVGMSLLSISSLGIKSNASSNVDGFNVIGALWGTTAAPISAAPGDHPDNLQITLQYIYAATATSIQGYLELPSGFSVYNGSSVAFASTTGTYPTGSSITLNYEVYISSSLSLGSYAIPLILSWSASGYSYLLNDTVSVTTQVLGRPQLYFSYSSSSLTAGVVNEVPVTISNNGSGTASSIFVTATSQVAGILNTLPEIQSLAAGSVTSETLQVYVPSSAAGSVLSVSLSASYKDQYGNSETATQSLNTYVSTQNQPRLTVSTTTQTLTPGQTDTVPLNITNSGTISLSQISTTLSISPNSVTMLGSFPYISGLNSGSSVNEQLSLYIPSSVASTSVTVTFTITYLTPNGGTGNTVQTIGFYTSAYVPSQSKLTVSTTIQSLTPGQTDAIPVTVTNGGNVTLTQISTALTVSPTSITLLGSSPYIATLNSGSSVNEQLSVFIPSAVSNSAVTITISSSFVLPNGATGTASQTLGFYTTVYVTSSSNTTVTVLPVNTNVTAGQQSKVIFQLENIGTGSVYSPTVSLTVSSPLVIVVNSSFTFQQTLSTKGALIYEATLTSSPSATIGTYSGTITVVYSDQQGNQHTQTFTVGFILSGLIVITTESETVTQSSRSLAISGTLLNEGTASAYYATAVACVLQTSTTNVSRTITTGSTSSSEVTTSFTTISTGSTPSRSTTITRSTTSFSFTGTFTGPGGVGPGSGTGPTTTTGGCPTTAASTYIGEIDPNSPIAFTASATFTPTNTSSSATLLLVITYRNTFGVTATQPITKQITLTPEGASTSITVQTGSSKNNDKTYVQYTLYGVIAVVMASMIAGGIFVRRRNSASSPGEQKVV